MTTFETIGWPWTDEGPLTDSVESKRARLRCLLSTQVGDHPTLPLYGVALNDALFESPTFGMKVAIRQAVRSAITRWEPGVRLPPGEAGVAVVEQDGHIYLVVRFIDLDEPEVMQEPLEVLLNG